MRRKNIPNTVLLVTCLSTVVAWAVLAPGGKPRASGAKIGAKAFFFRKLNKPRKLHGKNADEVRAIASLSKLMAALVIV